MVQTATVIAGMAIVITILGVAYFMVGLEGIGTAGDFNKIQEQIEKLRNDMELGDSSTRAISDGMDIDQNSLIEGLDVRVTVLETVPEVDLTEQTGYNIVSADLELKTYADAAHDVESKIFTRGDIINISFYNADRSKEVQYYWTDPNGVISDPLTTGSNEGKSSFIYRISDSAIPGKYILTVQIEEKEQSLNITINE